MFKLWCKNRKNRVIKPGENRGLIGICTEKSNFNSLLKERENSSRSSKTKKKIMGLPNLYFLLLLFSLLSFLQTPTSAAKKASLHLYIFFYSFYYFLYLIFQIHFSSTKLSLVNFCFKKCSDNTRKLYLLIFFLVKLE